MLDRSSERGGVELWVGKSVLESLVFKAMGIDEIVLGETVEKVSKTGSVGIQHGEVRNKGWTSRGEE